MRILTCLSKVLVFLVTALPVFAIEDPKARLDEIGVLPNLGHGVDLNLSFTNSSGEKVTLAQLLNGSKPALLIPVYYKCPRLCGLLLDGTVDLLNRLKLRLGDEYKVITVSFDSTEDQAQAAHSAQKFRAKLNDRSQVENAWHFLVGDQTNVAKLMDQIRFSFLRDGVDFAHSAAIIILTPQGRISQYFTGIEFPAWDVRLALIDASQGGIGSPFDHFLLYCFRFDPTKGKYTWAAFNVMRVGGVLTLLFLVIFIMTFARRVRAQS